MWHTPIRAVSLQCLHCRRPLDVQDRKDSRTGLFGRDERHSSRRKRSRSPERPRGPSRDDGRDSERRYRDRSERPRDSHRDKHRRVDSTSERRRSAEPPDVEPSTELNQREQDDIDKRAQRALAWQKLQADKQAAQVWPACTYQSATAVFQHDTFRRIIEAL